MRCISVLSKIIYTLLCKYDAYTPSPEMENRNTFARGSAYSPDFQTQVSEIETSSYEAKAPYTDIVTDLLSAEKNYVLLVRYTRVMQRVTFLPLIVKKIIEDPETLWIGEGVIISHSSTQLFACTPPFAYFKLLYFNAFYLFWNNTTEAWPKCMYKFTMNK